MIWLSLIAAWPVYVLLETVCYRRRAIREAATRVWPEQLPALMADFNRWRREQ